MATYSNQKRGNQEREIVLNTLAAIPYGCVCTYGEIASRSGLPGKARWVGSILKNLPKDSDIPWHRVINAGGRSSFPAGSEAYDRQMGKLRLEGIEDIAGKISLSRYGWK